MKKSLVFLFTIVFLTGCNFSRFISKPESPDQTTQPEEENTAGTQLPLPAPSDSNQVIQPQEFEYLGAFRLPDDGGDSSWEYSGRGLTFYPNGDPDGAADGYAGSLFGTGNDQVNFVSEISIPAPVISRNLEDLNYAETLQPFADITSGVFGETDLPRLGILYLPVHDGQSEDKLHFVHGQHIQAFEPSHGMSRLDLAHPKTQGPWVFDGYTNYVTSDYLFEIPENWAALIPGSPRLATGRFREGVWGGNGPTLFAYDPAIETAIPENGGTLEKVTPLLLYGVQEAGLTDITSDESMAMVNHNEDDSWWGGAWLTNGDRSAVIFVGTKALGKSWYGFANGVIWEYDCAENNPPSCPDVPEWPYENRGYWAEDYQPQILFFDPTELVKVANGEIETWQPQPYAVLDLSQWFYNPEIDLGNYKYNIAGSVAYDRENERLYIIERLADGYKSVVHVWRVN